MTAQDYPRGYRVALVADSLLESLLPELEREGYGVIQLPPTNLAPETAAAWLEQVAEHVAEFSRNGYELALASDGAYARELEAALASLGVAPPPPLPLATSGLTGTR